VHEPGAPALHDVRVQEKFYHTTFRRIKFPPSPPFLAKSLAFQMSYPQPLSPILLIL
jgi:hypothetical protein